MENGKTVVISACPPRSGSTLLYNAICGLINPTMKIKISSHPDRIVSDIKHLDVIKSHNMDFNSWDSILKNNDIDAYYISVERRELNLHIKSTLPNRTLLLQYEDLIVRNDYTLNNVVDKLYEKCIQLLPSNISLCKETCVKRINDMNRMVEKMKNETFTKWDKFFGIHGKHRNRV